MQLATRRPEIENFVIAAPPTPKYDFSVSIPCPASGLVIQGDIDERSAVDNVTNLVKEWRQQKNYTIEYEIVHSANHFFEDKIEEMSAVAEEYINTSLAIRVAKPVKKKRRRRKKKDRRYEGEE
jgi:alpha/beta superfamily hydrolase